jgi:Tfp pilus assembly protein PilF
MKKLMFATVCALSLMATGPALAGGGGGSSGGSSAPSSGPTYDPVVEYQKGVKAFEAGDYKAAEKAMKKVVKVAPKDANSQYILGMTYLAQNDAAKAVAPLKAAVKNNPALYDAHAKLGVAYVKSGKAADAESVVSGLDAIKAKCGAACADGAAIDAAKAEIVAAKSSAPAKQSGLPPAFRPVAAQTGDAIYSGALRQINLGQFDAGIDELTALQSRLGPHPDVLTYIGFAHRKQGDFETAFAFYNAALEIDPDHLSANEYLGEAHVERGDLASARKQLAKLEALCPFGCAQTEELGRWIDAAAS